MAKFRYRMQNILDIKRKLEMQAEADFGLANLRYQEEQQKLQQLILRRVSYEKALKQLMEGAIDVTAIKHARSDVNAVKNLVRYQMMEVHKAEKALESARIELYRLMKERKTQEKLRDKAFEAFKKEVAVEESKEIDELVSYTFNGDKGEENGT